MELSVKMKINVKSYYLILAYLKMLMWDIKISKTFTNIWKFLELISSEKQIVVW